MSFSVSRFPFPGFMERETGFEPATNSLEGCDSTPELLPRNRRSCHPRQHFSTRVHRRNGGQGRIRTSVPRSGADLQSAAINHSATCPSSRETKTIDPSSPRDPRAIRSVSNLELRIRSLEPAKGFEPATFRLQIGCSTVELRRRCDSEGRRSIAVYDLAVLHPPSRPSKSGRIPIGANCGV